MHVWRRLLPIIAVAPNSRVACSGKVCALRAAATQPLAPRPLPQVLPELRSADVNAAPLLKADALRFVTTFRSQLPASTLLGLLVPVGALLGAEAVVVHSYAATAIERFLALREGGRPK